MERMLAALEHEAFLEAMISKSRHVPFMLSRKRKNSEYTKYFCIK